MTFSLLMGAEVPLLRETGGVDTILLEDGVTDLVVEGISDVSPALLYGSITLKLNTLDFSLIDSPAPNLGDAITATDPAWTGTVAAVTTQDPVDLRNGHQVVIVTATNTRPLPNDTAPFDLSDVPVDTTFDYLLEDGTGHYLIESGTDFAPGALRMEGSLAYGYSHLMIRKQANISGPNTTLGKCIVQQPGLRPGNVFRLTSLNQQYNAAPFTVTQTSLTWHGANPPVPEYQIEFGDTPATLASYVQATSPATVAPVTPPLLFPAGVVNFGFCSAYPTANSAMGGGIVTICTATFTVAPDPGHTLSCQVQGVIDALAYAWDDYVAVPRRAVRAILSGGIYTGAWQELPGGWSGGSTVGYRSTINLASGSGLALAAGTYTVSVQINTVEYNQIRVFGAWTQVAVTQT